MPDETTDEQIASAVQSGDIAPFGLLVERYEAKMKRYAKKFLFNVEDSEDLVQEVFIKAFINIRGFDTNRKFSSWLYRIAHNQFINAIKKKGNEPLSLFDIDTLFPHPVAKDDLFKEVSKQEISAIVNKCLNQLSPKYREVLVLYFFEDLDYESIAEVLQIPKSTVGVRLNRAKIILKQVYNQLPHEQPSFS